MLRKFLSVCALLALVTSSSAVLANHLDDGSDDGQVEWCFAKLPVCFPGANLPIGGVVFPALPLDQFDCQSACSSGMNAYAPNSNACSLVECVDRCNVAFEFVRPPCG